MEQSKCWKIPLLPICDDDCVFAVPVIVSSVIVFEFRRFKNGSCFSDY